MARMLVEACVRLRARRELAGLEPGGCRCARRVAGACPQWHWRCRCGRWVRDLYWAVQGGPAAGSGPAPADRQGAWACRHCHGLVYRSQRLQARRAARRARAAAARLGTVASPEPAGRVRHAPGGVGQREQRIDAEAGTGYPRRT